MGSATITVTASDANASANQTFTATVVTNQAPTAVGTLSAQTMGLRSNSRTVNVSGNFSDPDGDSLSYTVSSSDTSKVTASISSATVSLRGVGVGSSTITVTASDGRLDRDPDHRGKRDSEPGSGEGRLPANLDSESADPSSLSGKRQFQRCRW